jgi:hypothetical protein
LCFSCFGSGGSNQSEGDTVTPLSSQVSFQSQL